MFCFPRCQEDWYYLFSFPCVSFICQTYLGNGLFFYSLLPTQLVSHHAVVCLLMSLFFCRVKRRYAKERTISILTTLFVFYTVSTNKRFPTILKRFRDGLLSALYRSVVTANTGIAHHDDDTIIRRECPLSCTIMAQLSTGHIPTTLPPGREFPSCVCRMKRYNSIANPNHDARKLMTRWNQLSISIVRR